MTDTTASTLKATLHADLNAAMRERDQVRTGTLRMVLTAVTNEEVSGTSARELSDDEVLKVIVREAKKRREAAEAFTTGGRPDRAERELAEGGVLEAYLPAQLSDEELTQIVREAISETGASGPQAMGTVMKVVNPKIAGRAEGGRVAAAVKAALAAG